MKYKLQFDCELVSKHQRKISVKYFNILKTNYGMSLDFRFLNVLIIIDLIYIGKK